MLMNELFAKPLHPPTSKRLRLAEKPKPKVKAQQVMTAPPQTAIKAASGMAGKQELSKG